MFHLKIPFTHIVAGPSSSGKSVFTCNFIKKLHEWIPNVHFKVLWCLGEKNALPQKLPSDSIIIHGLPSNNDIAKHQRKDNHVIVCIDDQMQTSLKNDDICTFFTRGSHHLNYSVILITQNLFHQSRCARDISLNCSFLTVMRNVRDKSQFFHLCRQIHPKNPKSLQRVYDKVMQNPYAHLFFNFQQECDDRLRYMSGILDPVPSVYVEPSRHEDAKKLRVLPQGFENV